MKNWLIEHTKGLTYFRKRSFSINEGRYPNIHVQWNTRSYRFFIYVALFWKIRFCFSIKTRNCKPQMDEHIRLRRNVRRKAAI